MFGDSHDDELRLRTGSARGGGAMTGVRDDDGDDDPAPPSCQPIRDQYSTVSTNQKRVFTCSSSSNLRLLIGLELRLSPSLVSSLITCIVLQIRD